MLSSLGPAHHEEPRLGRTLAVLGESARSLAIEVEQIVVGDASTDRTAEIAHGARRVAALRRCEYGGGTGGRRRGGGRVTSLVAGTPHKY